MKYTRQSLGRERALALGASKWWEGKTDREIAEFQLLTEELCCPFEKFHEAITKALKRAVFTHEFGSAGRDQLIAELFNGAKPASREQILALIPKEKQIIASPSP